MRKIPFIAIFISIAFFYSCEKEKFTNSADARLGLSADSLRFDTVFTTTGSVTKSFKILNLNDRKLNISEIKLAGGASSFYKINVNGILGPMISNFEIAANDSIYVFATVTINPNAAALPFIVSDSISISYNGNKRWVQLEAFGQNANFIRNGVITGNSTFTNALPYVILGGLQVTNTGVLNVNAGTRIYCHADAPILIDGTLICTGTKAQPIIFAGDRLDDPYKNYPAGWPGIYIRQTAKNSVLQFVSVKNAYQGIVVLQPPVNANPKLILQQSIVDNAFDAALLCTNTSATVENCLFSNSGKNIQIEQGGTYSFTHCTSVGYSNSYIAHKKPAIYISDVNDAGQTAPLTALLRNCIFFGDAGFTDTEIQTNKTGGSFSVTVDHCLYRAATDPANATFNTCIRNADPSFDSIDIANHYFDFRVTKNAAAAGINKGVATSLLKDLDDKNRNVGLPDLGAYEKQ